MTDSARSPGRADPAPTPVCLALEPDPVFGFLHLPREESRQPVAVLVCPPFGWEEACSYRVLRRWAQELAKAGFPAARIDLPGTGDSGGGPRDPDRLDAWTQAVSGAAAWLRERTECDRVLAVGIALGGLIACRALSQQAPIDELLLWGVPSNGRALLRELRAHAGVVAARYPADARGGPLLPDGASELIGFLIDAGTASALTELSVPELALSRAADRRVLIIGRDRLRADKQLVTHFQQSGAAVTVAAADGEDYGKLVAHPQEAQLPLETIALSISWLQKGAGGMRKAAAGPRTLRPRVGVERDAIELEAEGEAIRETPLEIEVPGGRAFAILSEPAQMEPAPLTALLFNAGALRHIGPNRTWVEIARRWAAWGVPTARVDLPGIGDADGDERKLVSNPALYTPARTAATLAVAGALGDRGLPDRFVLGGLCSGAYWSLHAALADPRVLGALMINLYAFEWSMELVAERETRKALTNLRGKGWRRLAKGGVSAERLTTILGSMQPGRIRAGANRPVEGAQRGEIEIALGRLRDQGTDALLLLSEGEPLYDQLARHRVIENLASWPNLTVERIPSGDHMFRALWLQRHVHDSLDRAVQRILTRAVRETPGTAQ